MKKFEETEKLLPTKNALISHSIRDNSQHRRDFVKSSGVAQIWPRETCCNKGPIKK